MDNEVKMFGGLPIDLTPVMVECPACGFDYAHPTAVRVNAGGMVTTVNSCGTRVTEDEPSGRGVLIEIEYSGECGHNWRVSHQFHKGQTSFSEKVTRMPRVDGILDMDPVIWRD